MPILLVVALISAQIHFFFSIFIVGFSLQSWINRVWSSTVIDQKSYGCLLVPIALGFYFNSVQFYILYSTDLVFSEFTVLLKYSLDFAIIIATLFFNYGYFRAVLYKIRAVINKSSFYLIIIALIVGIASFYYFPYAFDNTQLRWTQYIVRPEISFWYDDHNVGQIGYSSLIYFTGKLFNYIPLTTISSAFKPSLFVLIILSSLYTVEQLRYKPLWVLSIIYFSFLLFSDFGQSGAFITGKPSIYGVVFSLIFFASFLKPFSKINSFESCIYFSVAALTGIVSIPYMVAFIAVTILISNKTQSLSFFLTKLSWLAFFPLLIAISHITSLSLIFTICFLIFIIVIVQSLTRTRILKYFSGNVLLAKKSHFLPMLCLGISYFLMPALLYIPVNNPDSQVRFPLDGKTTLIEYFVYQDNGIALFVVCLGLIGAIILPFLVSKQESFGFHAFCIWPFTIIITVLTIVHLKLSIPLYEQFLWDMIKDIVKWYGGPWFGLLTLMLTVKVYSGFKNVVWKAYFFPHIIRSTINSLIAVLIFLVALLAPLVYYRGTVIPNQPTYASTVGHNDLSSALLAKHIWNRPGVSTFMLTNSASRYAEVIRYFGSHPNRLSLSNKKSWAEELSNEQNFWLFTSTPYVETFFEWLKARNSSAEYIESVDHNRYHLFFVQLNKQGNNTLPDFFNKKYELGTSLDFPSGTKGWKYLLSGWSTPEEWGIWSDGKEASLSMPLDSSLGDLMLSAKVRAYVNEKHSRLNVDVIANGEQVGQWTFVHGQNNGGLRKVIVPAEITAKQSPLKITFQIPNAKSPAELGKSSDKRQLGLGISKLRLGTSNYEVGNSVKFAAGAKGWKYLLSGWSTPEEWGIWSDGKEASLSMPLDSSLGDLMLSAKVRAYVNEKHSRLNVDVIANGEQVGQWTFVHGQNNGGLRKVIVPAEITAKQNPLKITFQIPNAKSPAELGNSSDKRQLGLGMSKLRVEDIKNEQ